eukprot:6102877-Prymnesium_polylepis.1
MKSLRYTCHPPRARASRVGCVSPACPICPPGPQSGSASLRGAQRHRDPSYTAVRRARSRQSLLAESRASRQTPPWSAFWRHAKSATSGTFLR